MFVILLQYQKPLQIVEKYLAAHRSYLDECYQQNFLIASGPQNPRTGGVILSQLSDKDKLQQVIEQDPFYINGVAEYQVIEFTPVKYHEQFSAFI